MNVNEAKSNRGQKIVENNTQCRLFSVIPRSLDLRIKRQCSLYLFKSYLLVTIVLKMYFHGIFSFNGCHTMPTFSSVSDIPEIPSTVVVFRFLNQCRIYIFLSRIFLVGQIEVRWHEI